VQSFLFVDYAVHDLINKYKSPGRIKLDAVFDGEANKCNQYSIKSVEAFGKMQKNDDRKIKFKKGKFEFDMALIALIPSY
jgi:hypothetical protein